MADLNPEVKWIVSVAHRDFMRTFEHITIQFMEDEAARQLRGEAPRGGPGGIINDALRRAGYLR